MSYTDDEIATLAATEDDETIGGSIARKLALELQRHRAMVKRLEAWAEHLEGNGFAHAGVATELRNRMRGTDG